MHLSTFSQRIVSDDFKNVLNDYLHQNWVVSVSYHVSVDAVNSIQCYQVIWTADQKVKKLIPRVTITMVGLNSEI